MDNYEYGYRLYILANHPPIDPHTHIDTLRRDLALALGEVCHANIANCLEENVYRNIAHKVNKQIEDAHCILQQIEHTQQMPIQKLDAAFCCASYLCVRLNHNNPPGFDVVDITGHINSLGTATANILAYNYLVPYMKGYATLWLRVSECQICGKFYPRKQERSRFCGTKCGMKEANRKRRIKY